MRDGAALMLARRAALDGGGMSRRALVRAGVVASLFTPRFVLLVGVAVPAASLLRLAVSAGRGVCGKGEQLVMEMDSKKEG